MVGADLEDSGATGIGGDELDSSAPGSGAAYVFTGAGVWSQDAYIKPTNTRVDIMFGRAIDLSGDGNTLMVSALHEGSSATGINGNQSDNNAEDSGAAYLLRREGTTWRHVTYVKASNTERFDSFGSSVALSTDATTWLVGAPGEDSPATGVDNEQNANGAENSGAVYVFEDL